MATKQNTPSVNAVAERVAAYAAAEMIEEFGIWLSGAERTDIYNAVYGVINSARVKVQQERKVQS